MYEWLPLGLRVLRAIENVVREEMNAIGGQEILLPALLPREPHETTGRWDEYGQALFRLQDRKGYRHAPGPHARGTVHPAGEGEYSSYWDLPLTLYQIQTKYRDEERPAPASCAGASS